MPQSQEEKEATLKELRTLYDKMDLVFRFRNPISHVGLMKEQLDYILKMEQNKNVKDWGALCKKAREDAGYTLEEVALKLHVSHVAVLNQEKIEGEYTVDPFYLEAFSILYDIKPMVLLGKHERGIIQPMYQAGSERDLLQNLIMNKLYKEKDPLKTDFLMAISKIGAMKFLVLNQLSAIFRTIPSLSEIPQIDVTGEEFLTARTDNDWRNDCHKMLPMDTAPDCQEYKDREAYLYAYSVTESLIRRESPVLKLMAQLATCDEGRMHLIIELIANGGLIKGKKSLTDNPLASRICRGY